MNLVDVAILAAVVLAVAAGHQLGLVTRSFAWAGLALGLTVGVLTLPGLVDRLHGVSPQSRLLVATAYLFGIAALGQVLGYAVGGALRARLPAGERLRRFDRVAGACLGGLGVLAVVWLLTPAMAATPGWPARTARGSWVMRSLDSLTPAPPRSVEAAIGRVIGDAPFPQVADPFRDPVVVGAPPVLRLDEGVEARVAASTVRIEGDACNQVQDGTGWVVAKDLVLTNAHVVAGERRTLVRLPDGTDRRGSVVVFDPRRDVAVVRVPNLGLASLRRRDPDVGDRGAVFGHPAGGGLRVAPARVADRVVALGTDVYRTSDTRRDVLVLAARLAPGDSGGPLVDEQGRVLGMAFAIDPSHAGTAYALTTPELAPVLERDREHPVDTGSCLVD
ncbi:MAG: MarP family serine protease [Acidimicrobiia bacterium]